jgi:hypothetical protein
MLSNGAFCRESDDESMIHGHRRQIDIDEDLPFTFLVPLFDVEITTKFFCTAISVDVRESEDGGATRAINPRRE